MSSKPEYYVTRDERGLFLGVHSLDEVHEMATPYDQGIRNNGAMLVIGGHRYTFPGAYFAIRHVVVPSDEGDDNLAVRRAERHFVRYPTAGTCERLRKSIDEATAFLMKAGKENNRSLGAYFKRVGDVSRRVYFRDDVPICIVPLDSVREAFGTDWFLVNDSTVQIVSTMSEARAKELAARAAGLTRRRFGTIAPPGEHCGTPPSAGASAKRRKAGQPEPASRHEPAAASAGAGDSQPKRSPLTIRDHWGRVVYSCGRRKGDQVRSHVLGTLPAGSCIAVPWGIQLTKAVEELGFGSVQDFMDMCVSAPRATRHESEGAVSFDGPDYTLYVCKGTFSCVGRGHDTESATGLLATLDGGIVSINVNHCIDCGRYFLGYREYQRYRGMYGSILGNFSFSGGGSGYASGFGNLNEESILKLCGYNVDRSVGLTSESRRLILANVMDRGICPKPRVMSHLEWLIGSREGNPDMRLACKKWRDDLDWVRDYHIDRQRRFAVTKVIRSR